MGQLERAGPGHGRGPQRDPLLAGVGVLTLGLGGAQGRLAAGLLDVGERRLRGAVEAGRQALLALLLEATTARCSSVVRVHLDVEGLVAPCGAGLLAACLALGEQGLLARDRVGHDVRAAVALLGRQLLAAQHRDGEEPAGVALGEIDPAGLDLHVRHAGDDDVGLERVPWLQVHEVGRLPELGARSADHEAEVDLGGQVRLEAAVGLDQAAEELLGLAQVARVGLAAPQEPHEAPGQRPLPAVAYAPLDGHVLEQPDVDALPRAGRQVEDLDVGDEVGVLDAQRPGPGRHLAEARGAGALQGRAGTLLLEGDRRVLEPDAGRVLDHDLDLGRGQPVGRASRHERRRDLGGGLGGLGRDGGLEVEARGLLVRAAAGEGEAQGDGGEAGGQREEEGTAHGLGGRTVGPSVRWRSFRDRSRPGRRTSMAGPPGGRVPERVIPRRPRAPGGGRRPRPRPRPRSGAGRGGRAPALRGRGRRPRWRRSS